MTDAEFQCADFTDADLEGAVLARASLWQSTLDDADLSLADLRAVKTDQLPDSELTKLRSRLKHRVRDRQQRGKILTRCVIATESVTPQLSAARVIKDMAMYDANGVFCGWGQMQDEAAYNRAASSYLGELACSNPYVARGLTFRALYAKDVSLTKALRLRDCPVR
jgi:uncharacterized protein YjbI with pentapeptide repeats